MSNKRIIVSVTNDISTDQRVRKVCEFLAANGFEVTLVGRKLSDSAPLSLNLSYKTKRFPLWFKKGPLFYASYNLRLFLFLLFRKSDVLLSNDLDTLYANVWANKFKKARLVYDSHELYTEVPELVNRPKVQRFWKKIERRCIPKVDVMYTVNQSIADIYSKEYNREVKVVRNISDIIRPKLEQTRKDLNLPEDKSIILIQGAGINIDRGAEEMVDAIECVENGVLVILGSGDAVPALKKSVAEKQLTEKVLFFDKRPYKEMFQFTINADVGVAMDKDTNPNYRYALGNKIFDYIHAGIPLFVSDLPEVSRIVRDFEVGVICPSHEPRVIAEKLNELLKNKEQFEKYRMNTKVAAQELTWENELLVLKEIYLDGK